MTSPIPPDAPEWIVPEPTEPPPPSGPRRMRGIALLGAGVVCTCDGSTVGLAAGGVAPLGTTHSSTVRSSLYPPSTVTIRAASIPLVVVR